jgi:glycosyltransferase involved in cell wall biosynthesis
LLVGDGPLKKKADEFVREHKLENMVFLTGYAPHHEIPEHLAAMDIVAAPYPKMDFFYFSPLKIFEYMAAGKAVIASRLGQIAELIQDGENGLLCEPDNFDQLLSITEKLIEDAALRHQLGVAARATMAERYSWQQNAQQIAEVIAKAATPQARAGKMELASEGFLNPNQIEV